MVARIRLFLRPFVLSVLVLALAGLAVGPVAAQQAPTLPRSVSELTQVAEDVYAFRYANHITMFVVTDEGVIAADPLGMQNPEAPNMLKAAIRSVTDQPVKYVLITHWGADHGMGGAAFADTAQFISHPATAQRIAAANNPSTPVPTILVTDHLALELGGKQIDIRYPGRTQADDYLVLHYPARELIFIVDFAPPSGLVFRDFPLGDIDEWVQSLDWIQNNLAFNTVVLGHPPVVASPEAVSGTRQYLLDLMDAIRASRAAGQADNSPEMVASVRERLAPSYGTWTNFESFLPLNIAGAVRTMD